MKNKALKKPVGASVSDIVANGGEKGSPVVITPKHHKKPKKIYE